jgi:hypothetical protein
MKLKNLIKEYDGTGCIRIDGGNGSGGPIWIATDEIDSSIANLSMRKATKQERAVVTQQLAGTELMAAIDLDDLHVSHPIVSDQRDNPYWYQIIY